MSRFLQQLFNIKGQVAAVIGGGGYLCSEMAFGLAKAGCHVVVMDLRRHKAERVAKHISEQIGAEALGIEVDASDKQSIKNALNQTLTKFGAVDILINGAGINSPTPFLDITIDEFNDVLKSQLTATLFGCQVFGEHMLNQKKGVIINISSASADPPLSKAFSYSIAKAGIVNLTKNLAREWATGGVRVNAIRPGFFPTEWNQQNFITIDREKAILKHTPMSRYGNANELVGAVIYLASDAASFVTGTELAVDGGFSCMTI